MTEDELHLDGITGFRQFTGIPRATISIQVTPSFLNIIIEIAGFFRILVDLAFILDIFGLLSGWSWLFLQLVDSFRIERIGNSLSVTFSDTPVSLVLIFHFQIMPKRAPCLNLKMSFQGVASNVSCLWIFTDNIYISIVNNWSMEPQQTPRTMNRIGRLVHGSHQQLKNLKILIIGVGGIGCQILKVLSKAPIGQIHILDMDTIEISNLNRQFLFKAHHKGMSKSLVAKESILKLNPKLNIEAHHMNIKDLQIAFFKQFGLLIMALDNIEARNYVNRIGVRLNIPIIDAGTLAYKGNATTILRQVSKCYSCEPKVSNQKMFPVCTIRMRPQKPIHCIVWAKMLFQAMFGGNTENDLSDMAQLAHSKDELAILTQLFQKEIQDIRNAKSDTDNKLNEIFIKNIKIISSEFLQNNIKHKVLDKFHQHDKVQSLESNVGIFVQAFQKLKQEKEKLGAVVFEKDDDDVIHFISSAANLRMHCFSIQQQSFNEVKNMAGNIVPAIASTNSIVSGIEIIEMIKYLRGKEDKLKSYFIQNQHNKIFALKLEKPLANCSVCSPEAIPVTVECNFNQAKLKDLIAMIEQKSPSLSQFSLNQGCKEIYNSDEPREILLNKTMLELCSSYEIDLILTDEDTSTNVCTIWVIHNENCQQLTITHEEKLKPRQRQEKMFEEGQDKNNNHKPESGDSDIVMFADQESPELEIIEPHKRERTEGDVQLVDEPKKKKKVQ